MTHPPGPHGQSGGYQYPPGYPPYPAYPQVRDTNIWAILSLISAFSIPPLAIIAGHVALSQIKRSGDQGRGLAIAGLVLGYVFTVVFVLAMVAGAWLGATEDDRRVDSPDYTYSMSVTSGLAALQNHGPLKLSSV